MSEQKFTKWPLILSIGLALNAISLTASTAETAAPCPDLSGAYTCTSEGKPVNLNIAQEVVNNQTIFTLTEDNQSSQLPSDNVEYKIDDKSQNMTGTARFVCEGAEFNVYLKGQKTDGTTTVIEAWDLVQGLSLDATKNLSVHIKGTQTIKGTKSPVDSLSVCNRNQKK